MHPTDIARLVARAQEGDLVVVQLTHGTLVAGRLSLTSDDNKVLKLNETTGLFLGNTAAIKELVLVRRQPGVTLTCNELLQQLIRDYTTWADEALAAGESHEASVLNTVISHIIASAAQAGRPVSFDTPYCAY